MYQTWRGAEYLLGEPGQQIDFGKAVGEPPSTVAEKVVVASEVVRAYRREMEWEEDLVSLVGLCDAEGIEFFVLAGPATVVVCWTQ